jgi:hypothetical protein
MGGRAQAAAVKLANLRKQLAAAAPILAELKPGFTIPWNPIYESIIADTSGSAAASTERSSTTTNTQPASSMKGLSNRSRNASAEATGAASQAIPSTTPYGVKPILRSDDGKIVQAGLFKIPSLPSDVFDFPAGDSLLLFLSLIQFPLHLFLQRSTLSSPPQCFTLRSGLITLPRLLTQWPDLLQTMESSALGPVVLARRCWLPLWRCPALRRASF